MSRAPRLSQNELDEEFEKFLKESLSDADDSMNTGKLKKFFDPLKRAKEKEKKESSQPWWMDDDDDGRGGGQRGGKADRFKKDTPSSTNKWLKPKKQSTPVIAEEDEDEDEVMTPVRTRPVPASREKMAKEKDDFASSSKPSYETSKAKPSMSRDSLESTPSPRGMTKPDYDSDEFESDNDDRSGVHPAQGSFEDTMSYTGPSSGTTLGSTGPGAETMEEMADKNKFFQELEEKEGRRIDYNKLNQDIDMTGTLGTMGSLPSPYMGTADEHSSPIPQIMRHMDESKDTSEEVDSKSREESSSKVSPATVKESKKQSMLSRVALLETGDSTLHVNKGDALSREKAAGDAGLQTTTGSKGLSVTGTADDMEALQAVLRDAANTPTMGLEDSSFGVTYKDKEPPATPADIPVVQPRTVEDILREVKAEKKLQRQKEKEEENRKRQEEEEQRRKEEEVRRKQEEVRRKIEEDKKALLGDSVDGEAQKVQEPSGFDLSPINTQEGRGIDLQPANEGRVFDLQPANEGHGFDLQPANEGSVFDLQPANQQPFSADDEASYGISSSTPSNKGKPKQSSKSRGRYGNIKSSGYGHKPKITEVWSPVQAAKHKVKGAEIPMMGRKPTTGHNKNLIQSVESFATYIQEHFADSRKLTPPPEVRHSREEPIISSGMRESKIQHLSREKALIAEINEWQNQWKDAHRLNAKLKAELATKQREFVRKEEEHRLLHEKEMFKLKQDNFVLQAKLNTEEEQKMMKNKAISGRPIEGASEEEIKLMQKEIIEQETLLQGYQQVNFV
ncbi:uncharacterized protein [Amphiura filiformis]|uniref:uncharacterized protein n=1 Tax=Amphiura filiformis TaxID=82378 RepID=UPI003B21FC1F